MTDTYAEEILIERFKEMKGLTRVKTERILADGTKKNVVTYTDVAFPNIAFERPDNGYWYELYFIPARPTQLELGTYGRNRWVGVMQINVCVPKSTGVQALYERYDYIARLFRQGMNLNHVRINRVYRSTASEDGDYYFLPVSIDWWADLDRDSKYSDFNDEVEYL